MTAPLPSTTDTTTIERRIRRAFRAWCEAHGRRAPKSFETVYEHGHWWVRTYREVFDAVDAAGGDSVDGFSFEALS